MQAVKLTQNTTALIGEQYKSNSGLIEMGDYSILIDTGHGPNDGKEILKNIKEHGFSPLKYIIFTHYHPDHISGASVLGGEIIAHTNTYSFLNEKPNNTRLPQKLVDDRMTIKNGEMEVTLISAEGHCKGSLLVYVRPDNIIFAGDNFFKGCYPYFAEANLSKVKQALGQIKEMAPEWIVPGHGQVGDIQDVQYFEKYLDTLMEYGENPNLDPNSFPKFWGVDFGGFHAMNMKVARLSAK